MAVLKWFASLVLPALISYMVGCTQQVTEKRPDPRDDQIDRFIHKYFNTWSLGQIDNYGLCFHEQAIVQHIDKSAQVTNHTLKPFLESQRQVHNSPGKRTEYPLAIEIAYEAELARVYVPWELDRDGTKTRGRDHFLLKRFGSEWKILNLVFYSD